MKLLLKYAWIAGLLIITLALKAGELQEELQSEYLQTPDPGRFLQQQSFKPGTLVILDLDDTTITSPEGQWLGRSDMFYDLLAREQKKYPDKNKVELAAAIDPLLSAVYQRVPVTVTDSTLPSAVKTLTNKGVSVIAMTSRGIGVKDVTLKQLERVNIHFSDLGDPRWASLDKERTFRIEKPGVVFVSHGNKKGEVLIHLLKEGFLKDKKHIYLIDDRERHLKDVSAALKEYDPEMTYTPVLCTYLADKMPYNPSAASQELMSFLIAHGDEPEIEQLMSEDAYTKQVISNCLTVLPDKEKECLAMSEKKGSKNKNTK